MKAGTGKQGGIQKSEIELLGLKIGWGYGWVEWNVEHEQEKLL